MAGNLPTTRQSTFTKLVQGGTALNQEGTAALRGVGAAVTIPYKHELVRAWVSYSSAVITTSMSVTLFRTNGTASAEVVGNGTAVTAALTITASAEDGVLAMTPFVSEAIKTGAAGDTYFFDTDGTHVDDDLLGPKLTVEIMPLPRPGL